MVTSERQRLANLASGDRRLAPILEVLAKEPVSVLSLDVFDTLVWRLVPEPVDAFLLLGRRLHDGGHLATNISPPLFARLRERAELKAREATMPALPSMEASLESIYERMSPRVFTGIGVEDLAGLEVELERAISFPDLEVVRLAQLVQQECGVRVVLVSDTYYSEAQLRRMLDRDPFTAVKIEKIFSSSQLKVNKGTGLYRVVLEELGVQAGEVLHVGDHPEADVTFPAEVGLRTVHFARVTDELREVLKREGLVRPGPGHQLPASIDQVAGDFGLTALRSKAAFRSGGAHLSTGVRPYWEFGATVLGAVFTGFADWVHRRAREEGVEVVHCLMREGEFLSRLVNGARDHLGSPVRAEPLWLSRQLCARAAIFHADGDELSSFLNRRRMPTLRHFCDGLGVTLAQLPELFNDGDGRLDDADLWQRTLEAITRRPELRAAIVASSAELRERLAAHFLRTVGEGTTRVVVVDLGWGATIQAHLHRVLTGSGLDVDTLGLYLLTNEAAVDRMLAGVRTDGYLASGGLPEEAVRRIIRSPEILEQVCMTDVGTLVDFTAEGEPVTAPLTQSPVQMLQRSAVQGGILEFQDEWARYGGVVPVDHRTLDERARHLLLKSLLRLVVSPTAGEASMFGPWSHDDNFGSKDAERVIFDELAPLLKYMTPDQLLRLRTTKVYWPFGLAALHNPSLAQAVTAVLDDAVPAEAFSPGASGSEVTISVDSVGALSGIPKRLTRRLLPTLTRAMSLLPRVSTTKQVVVRPNAGGLCFLHDEVWHRSIRHVQVELPPGPGVVRLDRMALAFKLRGRPDSVHVHIEWPQQFREVTYARCTALSANLLYGPQQSPQIIYTCPPEWGGDAYSVEVELAFAWLPTAPTGEAGARTEPLWELAERLRERAAGLVRGGERSGR